jgi:hypothetical protein
VAVDYDGAELLLLLRRAPVEPVREMALIYTPDGVLTGAEPTGFFSAPAFPGIVTIE